MDTPIHRPLQVVRRPQSASHLCSLDIISYKLNKNFMRDNLHAESSEISRIEPAHCRKSSGRAKAIAVNPSSSCKGIGSTTYRFLLDKDLDLEASSSRILADLSSSGSRFH